MVDLSQAQTTGCDTYPAVAFCESAAASTCTSGSDWGLGSGAGAGLIPSASSSSHLEVVW